MADWGTARILCLFLHLPVHEAKDQFRLISSAPFFACRQFAGDTRFPEIV